MVRPPAGTLVDSVALVEKRDSGRGTREASPPPGSAGGGRFTSPASRVPSLHSIQERALRFDQHPARLIERIEPADVVFGIVLRAMALLVDRRFALGGDRSQERVDDLAGLLSYAAELGADDHA